MKKHVLGYLRTRETYAAYKKSGYARKFLIEHEQEILIHRAAKQAFDERKLTKLPTVQMLQTEYEALTMQRKKDYAEYRDAKNEMRELLTVRANVERILNEPMEQRDDAAQKSRNDNGILRRYGFENSVFPQKDAQPQDCAERGFGGNATNKQMHKRVPVCPACRYAMGQEKTRRNGLV